MSAGILAGCYAFICCDHRAKNAKLAKEEKGGFVCYLCLLITRYAHLQNPFLPFFFSSLGVLGVLCAFARVIADKLAPQAPTSLASFAL